MSEILNGLNDKQLEAVTHKDGPMLVIAGAGSGKTKALTHRIAYLIQEENISPYNILAVTFTNKAANEMKQRVQKLLRDKDDLVFMESFADIFSAGELERQMHSPNLPTIGTFHSICVRILRKHIHNLDYENSFAIYDSSDQQILIKRIMKDQQIDPKKINPKAVLSHISNAKNQLIGPKDFQSYSSDYFQNKVAEIYPLYQNALKRNNAVDFDDIIMKTVELFQRFPKILESLQNKFKYISVDEYQDTNKAQFMLINSLAAKYRNLVVIGDSDQSIYGWRGATIQNILDFEKHYPDTKTVKLEQNYRSTQVILDASNIIIKKNSLRQEKKLWTSKEGGEKIKIWLAQNERHEADMIAQEIVDLNRGAEYTDYSNYVVLYRTNAQSRVIEEVFLRYGLPYKIVGGIKFYERKEIKDIMAYLRVVSNPNDSVSLLRIINTPSRKIGARTLEQLQIFSAQNSISIYSAILRAREISDFSASKVTALEKFSDLIKSLQNKNSELTASGMIKNVLEESGYKKLLDDGSVEGQARLENIQELISVSSKYDKLEPGLSLSIFLEELSLISDVDSMESGDNSITLMTIHSAKGLEFNTVFIAGLEEGIFPHSRSLLDNLELEEERRLMYVAVTRARERLYLLCAQNRMLYGESKSNSSSQFLDDIPVDLSENNFAPSHNYVREINTEDIKERAVPLENETGIELELDKGDRVSHISFGNGVVIDIQGGVVTIAFEDYKVGIKKLAISIAPLKKI